MNERNKTAPSFNWENGYLAVSTQEDKINYVDAYIRSDENRHAQHAQYHQIPSTTYHGDLYQILKQQNIDYHEKYFHQRSHAKIYVHAVWSTYNRMPTLEKSIRPDVYNRMINIISSCNGIVNEIGGIEDHVHVLFELPRDKALSDLLREVKTSITHWLKKKDWKTYSDFQWQTGFGAYTVSLSNVQVVKNYIQKQEEHHNQHQKTFNQEWNSLSFMMME